MNANPIKLRRFLLAIVIFVIGLVVILEIISYEKSHHDIVKVQLRVPVSSISFSVNNKTLKPIQSTNGLGSYNFKIHSGNCNLVVSAPGYKTISTSFALTPRQNTSLSLNLIPSQKPAASDLSKIMITSPSNNMLITMARNFPGATAQATYFDNNTWALVLMSVKGGLGGINFLDRYYSSLGGWVLVTQPSDIMDTNSAMGIPSDLQSYLVANGIIGS